MVGAGKQRPRCGSACWRLSAGGTCRAGVPTDAPSENGVVAPWVRQSPYRTRVCVHRSLSRREDNSLSTVVPDWGQPGVPQ